MNRLYSSGQICIKGKYNIEYRVCKIEYELRKDGSFVYTFTPNYCIIELLDKSVFQGIPGLNLEVKKEKYVRNNKVPTFISERVPNEKRENFNELLEEVDMEYMDPLLYLKRTKRQYFGDNFYVIEDSEKELINIKENEQKNNVYGLIKILLDNIAKGNDIKVDDYIIDNKNRVDIFKTLIYLYNKRMESIKDVQLFGIEAAKQKNKYKGRKPIDVDRLAFLEIYERIKKKEITVKEGAKKLGISIDKYYRVKKQIKNNN